MNFIKRNAWYKVKRTKMLKLGRKAIKVKWVFKVKHEHDGSTRKKSRCVVQGFMQMPGVDYTESFSPVATDTGIRMVVATYLMNEDDDWVL